MDLADISDALQAEGLAVAHEPADGDTPERVLVDLPVEAAPADVEIQIAVIGGGREAGFDVVELLADVAEVAATDQLVAAAQRVSLTSPAGTLHVIPDERLVLYRHVVPAPRGAGGIEVVVTATWLAAFVLEEAFERVVP